MTAPAAAPTSPKLDPDQHAAVHTPGPLAVLAGPGSGKTRVIISRIERLVREGADPARILGLTFTVKAAGEMRERLAEALDRRAAEAVRLETFHSFGRTVLRRHADRLGLPHTFDIIDSAQRRRMIRSLVLGSPLFPAARFDRGASATDEAIRTFAELRNHAIDPEAALERAKADLGSIKDDAGAEPGELDRVQRFHACASIFAAFEKQAIERAQLEFDHFLTLPIRLLLTDSFVRDLTRADIAHVLVDEFQDVNAAQLKLLTSIAPPAKSPDVCVVGDDDQSIYGFRGSDPRAFEHFAAAYPSHATVALAKNYRSRPAIVRTGQAIIARADERFAPDKVLEPMREPLSAGDSPAVQGILVDDDSQLGAAIAADLNRRLEEQPDLDLSSVAVIARIHSTADTIALALEQERIPVDRRRSTGAFDHPLVQDIISWLRLSTSHATTIVDLTRILVRPPFLIEPRSIRAADLDRRERTRSSEDGSASDAIDDLAAHAADDDLRAAAARVSGLLEQFRADALFRPASELIESILRDAGVAAAGQALEPRERAVALRAVVALIRFAREKAGAFGPPGTAQQMLEYLDDLDAKERENLSTSSIAQVDTAAEETAGGAAVSVITAHAAKGLEFDLVYIPRVRSPHGYPYKSGQDEPSLLPAEFLTASNTLDDEERRLFFVAATRAREQLVVLAARRKTRTKSTDFFNELEDDAVLLPECTRDHREQDEPPPPEAIMDAAVLAADRTTAIDREQLALRHRAFAALHRATTSYDDPDELARARHQLGEVARALAAAQSLRAGSSIPDDLQRELPRQLLEPLIRLEKHLAQGESAPLLPPPAPPLELSYSQINQYLECPLTYYITYVLRLREPPGEHMLLGQAVHKVLEDVARSRWTAESEGRPYEPPTDREIEAIAEQAYVSARGDKPFDAGMFDRVIAHARNGVAMDDGAEALYLENKGPTDAKERKRSFPYELDGHVHRIEYKLDRVDRLPDGSIRIVDYKTGGASKSKLSPERTDLQLCMYAMALPLLLEESDQSPGTSKDLPAGVAEYWLTATGERGAIDLQELNFKSARGKINKAIRGILAGRFERGRNSSAIIDLLPA